MTAPNQVWVSDLTYLHTETGFVYLAVVLDLFARRVVGWAVSCELDAGIAVEALPAGTRGAARVGRHDPP